MRACDRLLTSRQGTIPENSYSQFGLRGRAPRGVTGELSPASVYVSLLPVVEACVVVAVPGRVGEVRVAADEPEAVDLDPGVLSRAVLMPQGR